MTKKLKTVRQVMELSIHHDITPEGDQPRAEDEWDLDAHLDTLPAELATAIRAELAKGTLVVNLVPGSRGLRVSPSKPRGRRPKPASGG